MDPYKGVIRWSIRRFYDHLASVLAAVVAIPTVTALVAAFVLLPAKPTVTNRIETSLAALGGGILAVAVCIYLYALLCAPYEQRRVLRERLNGQQSKLDSIEGSAFEALNMTELEQVRIPPAGRPFECSRLQLAMIFQNDSDITLKYSLKEVSAEANGIRMLLPVSADVFRIASGRTDKCVAYIDIDPPLASGEMVGLLEYCFWYGPLSEPAMYGQRNCIRFTNNGMLPNHSYINMPGRKEDFVRVLSVREVS